MTDKLSATVAASFTIELYPGCENAVKTVRNAKIDVYIYADGGDLSKDIKVATYATDESGGLTFVLPDKITLPNQPLFGFIINADQVAYPVESNTVYYKFDSTKGRTFFFVIGWFPWWPPNIKSNQGGFAVSGRSNA